jgi:hypothetical protein
MNYGLNLFYFFTNHPSSRFNQNISPTSYSNDSNHSINTHFFLLPYYKWNLYVSQVGFKNSVYSKRSCGSSGVMSLSNHARGTTIDLHNRKRLAECIETPYILKILHIGVSILPREDAFIVRYATLRIVATHHIARRPGLKMYNYTKKSGGRVLCGTTIDLYNRKRLAECIETPYILKILHIGVSILPREDAFIVRYATLRIVATHHIARRPDLKMYNYTKKSGGRVLCGTTMDLHNQKSLAECIETPYILKILHIGVSTCGELGRTIQILQEDAKFTRRGCRKTNKLIDYNVYILYI